MSFFENLGSRVFWVKLKVIDNFIKLVDCFCILFVEFNFNKIDFFLIKDFLDFDVMCL